MSSAFTIKGAVHLHTTMSHDGTLDLPELKQFFVERGFHFLCVTDHSHDVTPEQYREFVSRCDELSDEQFVFVPGIEFSCIEGIHILGIGLKNIIAEDDPLTVVDYIRESSCVAILAHPTKKKQSFDPEWVHRLNGIEIWNGGYDGKFLPQRRSILKYNEFRTNSPHLRIIFGMDLHTKNGFYDLATMINSSDFSSRGIVEALRDGRYYCRSRFLSMESRPPLPAYQVVLVSAARALLNVIRSVRNRVVHG